MINVIDTRDGLYKKVTKDDYKKYDYFVSTLKDKVIVLDIRDNVKKYVSKEDFDKFDFYKSVSLNLITVIDTRDNTTKKVTKEDYNKYDYFVSLRSKRFAIYDANNLLRYTVYGNFSKFCAQHRLPVNAFCDSIKFKLPIPIKQIKRNFDLLKKHGFGDYIGWYAQEVK